MGVSRMECIDFDRYEQNDRMYGGLSGAKIGICYHGANYILKYPQNLKERHFNFLISLYMKLCSECVEEKLSLRVGIFLVRGIVSLSFAK